VSIALFDERVPVVATAAILPADTTGAKSLYTAPASGARFDDILIWNNDTIAHELNLTLRNGGTPYGIGSVSIAAGAGTAGAPAVNLAATLAPTAQAGWVLPSGVSLELNVSVAVQAGKVLAITAFGGLF